MSDCNLEQAVPRNEFLATTRSYTNLVLHADCKLAGEKCNGGIQIRTQRIPDHHEVVGYQADMSSDIDGGYWGKLYDESRRKKVLGETLNHAKMLENMNADGWNHYEIRCEGPRIQIFLNGIQKNECEFCNIFTQNSLFRKKFRRIKIP